MMDDADLTPLETHCGYVALVGRPNVGKSTLLNKILGQKVSITSKKPQTTRHTLLGIDTQDNTQVVYVDTPGIHRQEKRAVNRYMNRAAASALMDVDLVIFMIAGLKWSDDDQYVFEKVKAAGVPVILVVNKVDKITDKSSLLPWIESLKDKMAFADIIPISAKKGENVAAVKEGVIQYMPHNPFFFPEDQITDRSGRFMAAEIIREKLTRLLGQELPYALTVQIEAFETEEKLIRISAIIWVEHERHKPIVIGKAGSGLKAVGRKARLDMETLFEQKVFLTLWVKVKRGWSDDERALQQLGYT